MSAANLAITLVGAMTTAVVWGTDVFFLLVGRPALRAASEEAGTEVMGWMHWFADARMPVVGGVAMVANLTMLLAGGAEHRWLHGIALLTLVMFVVVYQKLARPINEIQTVAARAGRRLEGGRELQAAWDRYLAVRVALLGAALAAQLMALALVF